MPFNRTRADQRWIKMAIPTTAILLGAICVLSIGIRMFPVVKWGSVIHEFDPHFNFRVTKFLTENGFMELLNWFDDRAWFPLGRVVGTTLYPGLMLAAAAMYWALHAIGIPVQVRDVCVMLAPIIAAFSSIALYMLTKEVTKKNLTALLAATFMALSPGYISRSTAGSYDNEGIAIFLLIITFYFWIKAVTSGSMFWAAIAALAYFGMVVSWGGYVLIINLIPLHVLALVVSGHYSPNVYVAYATFYPLATLLSMQVPFVGFNTILKAESVASHGMFALLQAIAFAQWLNHKLPAAQVAKLVTAACWSVATAGGVTIAILMMFGKLQWSGRSLTLLDPTYASKHIPIVASVGEHQPTAWAAFYSALGPAMLLVPLGVYYCFESLTPGLMFMVVYGGFAFYFSGIMVRLLLTLAPVAAFLSAVGFSNLLERISIFTKLSANDHGDDEEKKTQEEKVVEASSAARKRQASKNSKATPPAAPKPEDGGGAPEVKFHLRNLFSFTPKNASAARFHVPVEIGVLLIAILMLLVIHVRHCTKISRRAYSSTQMVHEAWNRETGQRVICDDYREAYWWLRQNTHEDARILSWWDYGYQLSVLANRTVVVDNNTWNNTHIATAGKVLLSNEEEAAVIMRSLGVDYVLIFFGGYIGMGGDDLDKLPWIVRISEGVFPDSLIESEFQVEGMYTFHENGTSAMQSSLLYKFSYFDFDAVNTSKGVGVDVNRGTRPGGNVSLTHFDEVFTTEDWIVRIYRLKQTHL
ncbi:TPA: hypothetical protein N0F65_012389 [Lagenidium giganteum]|uniref:dolichyl-diphosphooligosaccharide--protein glycotransferase n=1 Tax=Lagenidium giganteum TaxID=4803 RepID=A0AAV2YSJ6_9STRA|nr:TPA: hypothetical protein N0F65_012389 [Lagenidium giganteum]